MNLNPLVKILVFLAVSKACTEIRVTAKDSSVVIGRSMEFMFDIQSDMYTEPEGYPHTAIVPSKCDESKKEPLKWKNRNTLVYLDAIKMPFAVTDGQNAAGLSFGALYFNEYAKYQNVPENKCGNAVSHLQLGLYILGRFETVKELRDALDDNTFPLVWEHSVDFAGAPTVFQLHYSIQDKTGDSLIIEYSDRGRIIFENPVGVFTNSPHYDWHMLNLRNYVHVSNFARETLVLGEAQFNATSEGSGLLGLPGDVTAPGRLVRAGIINSFVEKAETSEAAVNLAVHVLNIVDIPHGLLRHTDSDFADYTEWIVMKDLSTNTLYYRVYNDLTIRSIPLGNLGTQRLKMKVGRALGGFVDTTNELEPADVKTEL